LELRAWRLIRPYSQNMRRKLLWIQLNVIPRTLPNVASVRQQIVHRERKIRIDSELLERQLDKSRLGIVGIQVHNYQDQVRAVVTGFRISNQLIVGQIMKAQSVVTLQ